MGKTQSAASEVNHDRRQFLRNAAMTIAAAQLSGLLMIRPASAEPSKGGGIPIPPTMNTFRPVKQINAGVLNVGYVDVGPADGSPVILLHGWPYDIHSYVDVAPLLATAGYRVIVPYMRGFGSTTFLSSDTFRNGQQSVMAVDVKSLMDALNIEKAIIAGYDLGGRTADIVAALWPERCKALVSVSGYLITSLKANLMPLPPAAELGWWYQYYFATNRGMLGYSQNLYDFNKLIWKIVSPNWGFDDATYNQTAAAFNNPDHVAIVIHNYRWRQSLAAGDPQYDGLEAQLAESPVITVPTITIASDFDWKNYGLSYGPVADGTAYRNKFSGKYSHLILDGIGHNVPQEAPQAFANAVIEVDGY